MLTQAPQRLWDVSVEEFVEGSNSQGVALERRASLRIIRADQDDRASAA